MSVPRRGRNWPSLESRMQTSDEWWVVGRDVMRRLNDSGQVGAYRPATQHEGINAAVAIAACAGMSVLTVLLASAVGGW